MSGPSQFSEAALPLFGGQANRPVGAPKKLPSYIEGHRARLHRPAGDEADHPSLRGHEGRDEVDPSSGGRRRRGAGRLASRLT